MRPPRAGDLRGDLDTIALKALRAEPAERYDSVAELAEDLGAWRANLPIRARPPSLSYREGKLLRRNRRGTILALAGLVTLSAFIGAAARKQATTLAERDRAKAEAERAGEVIDFMLGLFEVSRPEEALGRSVTAGELLKQGVRIADVMEDKPLARAQMLDAIGRAYTKLGKFENEEPLLREGLEIRRGQSGVNDEDTRSSVVALIGLYDAWGRPEEGARLKASLDGGAP